MKCKKIVGQWQDGDSMAQGSQRPTHMANHLPEVRRAASIFGRIGNKATGGIVHQYDMERFTRSFGSVRHCSALLLGIRYPGLPGLGGKPRKCFSPETRIVDGVWTRSTGSNLSIPNQDRLSIMIIINKAYGVNTKNRPKSSPIDLGHDTCISVRSICCPDNNNYCLFCPDLLCLMRLRQTIDSIHRKTRTA